MERNEKLRSESLKKFSQKNINEERRHEKNVKILNKENQKLAQRNKNRILAKFCSFYWQRRKKEEESKNKIIKRVNKLAEMTEKFHELEKNNDLKRNKLIKKMKTMNLRRENFEKSKFEKYLQAKVQREKRFSSCEAKRKGMSDDLSERRKEILFYQNVILCRSYSRDKINNMKKSIANERTINEQITLEKELPKFNKQMNNLKSKSILKKSIKERFKIYKEFKKKEEELKKEMEENMKQ